MRGKLAFGRRGRRDHEAPSSELHEPAAKWHEGLSQGDLKWDGYTFLGDPGALRSLPCRETMDFGGCTHVGVFLPLCSTAEAAREAATRRLAEGGPTARLIGDRRWIFPISVRAQRVYDVTRRLAPGEGEYVVAQLFHGDGKHPRQASWHLAKSRGCQGILIPIPADALVLFLYERFWSETIGLGPRDPVPVEAPEK